MWLYLTLRYRWCERKYFLHQTFCTNQWSAQSEFGLSSDFQCGRHRSCDGGSHCPTFRYVQNI